MRSIVLHKNTIIDNIDLSDAGEDWVAIPKSEFNKLLQNQIQLTDKEITILKFARKKSEFEVF